jgi:PAS domain-containing protein
VGSVRQRDANPREWERAALHAEERLRHLSAERHLEQRLLSLEHAVTRALAEAQGAPEGLKSLIKAVCELQGWDYGRYWQLDEGAGVLRFGASWSVPDPVIVEHLVKTRDLIFTPGKGLVGIVLQTGKPVLEPDLSRNPLVLQEMFARQSGLRGACTFPVNFEGETIGVLAFVGREVREADARLLEAMAAIGSQVGQFLKRKQAEAEIRESESRYRSLVGLAADWYWETDADYRFTRVHMQSEAQPGENSRPAPLGTGPPAGTGFEMGRPACRPGRAPTGEGTGSRDARRAGQAAPHPRQRSPRVRRARRVHGLPGHQPRRHAPQAL